LDPYKQAILNQEYGLCPECNQPNTYENWCKECYSKKSQQDFGNWTGGNEYIDKFIQESQLNARNNHELLEWIPYNRLRNIQYLTEDWKRISYQFGEQNYKDVNNPKIKNPLQINEKYGHSVVLKSLNDSSNINNDFLNEWKLHLQCQHEARSNYTFLIPLLGITQDPDTLNYMIIMFNALYVHGDFHNGNVLYADYKYPVISDLGLCRPVNQSNVKND
ncbi:hypothetical protein C1645_830032, partial [Glomus cerebriforme]